MSTLLVVIAATISFLSEEMDFLPPVQVPAIQILGHDTDLRRACCYHVSGRTTWASRDARQWMEIGGEGTVARAHSVGRRGVVSPWSNAVRSTPILTTIAHSTSTHHTHTHSETPKQWLTWGIFASRRCCRSRICWVLWSFRTVLAKHSSNSPESKRNDIKKLPSKSEINYVSN